MYASSATYRGGRNSLPSYVGSDNEGSPFFGKRRSGKFEWHRITLLGLLAGVVVLLVVVLLQTNRISLLGLDVERLNRESKQRDVENASLRASLSNASQEKEFLERQLKEAQEKKKDIENEMKRMTLLRENLQEELRTTSANLKKCETGQTKEQDKIKADLRSVTRDRDNLKGRVDTEQETARVWAQKAADEKKEKEKCQEELKKLQKPGSGEGLKKIEIDTDLGRKDVKSIEGERTLQKETSKDASVDNDPSKGSTSSKNATENDTDQKNNASKDNTDDKGGSKDDTTGQKHRMDLTR